MQRQGGSMMPMSYGCGNKGEGIRIQNVTTNNDKNNNNNIYCYGERTTMNKGRAHLTRSAVTVSVDGLYTFKSTATARVPWSIQRAAFNLAIVLIACVELVRGKSMT